MKHRVANKIALPVTAICGLLLLLGISGGWYVLRLQRQNSYILDVNVASIRAAVELEILVRQMGHELDRYLLTQEGERLDQVLGMEPDVKYWLSRTIQLAFSPEEKALAEKMRVGLEELFQRLAASADVSDATARMPAIESLVDDVLSGRVLEHADQYLDLNEQQLQHSNEQNKAMAERLALALLLLGTCGSIAGLLGGYGVARGIRRSIFQLSVPIRDVAGKLNEVVGPISLAGDPSMQDLEVLLQKLAAHVGTVVEQLHARHREVIRADQLAAVGQLAAGLAHELRNPLMCMKVLVQAAARHGESATLDARDVAVLNEEITRLENLVQSFLDFARPAQLEKKQADLAGIIRQTVEFVAGRAERRNVEIECRLPLTPLVAEVDAGQFRQVLLNLILNALDAVRNGGRIWVEAEIDGPAARGADAAGPNERRLRVRVADNGRGLPGDDRRRIYEPFFSTKETGLGLGLAVCQRIVEVHGGEIHESDREGGGAVFEIVLPERWETSF